MRKIIILFLSIITLTSLGAVYHNNSEAFDVSAFSKTEGSVFGGDIVEISGEFEREVKFTQISAGWYHVLALADNGRLYAWGQKVSNANSQDLSTPTPVDLPAGIQIKQFLASNGFSLVLTTDGEVYAWGSNSNGRLGIGAGVTSTTTPTKLDPNTFDAPVTYIASGGAHTIAVTDSGQTYGWGKNQRGEIAVGSSGNDILTPTPVDMTDAMAGVKAVQAAANDFISIILGDNGKLYTSGNGRSLGNGGTTDSDVLVEVDMTGDLAGKTVTQVHSYASGAYVIDGAGDIYAWGGNSFGQTGTGSAVLAPTQISSLSNVSLINQASVQHTVVLADGQLFSWGRNTEYQLGIGNDVSQNLPQPINFSPNVTIKQVEASYYASYVLTDDGDIYAWGANSYGELGDGTNTNVTTGQTLILRELDEVEKLYLDGQELEFTLNADGKLEFITPPHAEGYVDLELVGVNGSRLLLKDAYRYIDYGEIGVPNTGIESL